MARVSVNVDLKPTRAELIVKHQRGQYALANQALTDMNRYVPKLSTDLRQTGTLGNKSETVIWNTPYARRQFYNHGANFTTPGTGPRWDEKAQSIHGSQWEKIVGRAMR